MSRWLILVILCLATPAQAQVAMMSSFDSVDCNTLGTGCDSLEFFEDLGGGAVDADISIQSTEHHGLDTDGPRVSIMAVKVNVASGRKARYRVIQPGDQGTSPNLPENSPAPWASAAACWALGWNMDTLPGSGNTRRFMENIENDATPVGCWLRYRNDGKADLLYGSTSPTSFGTSADVLHEWACQDHPRQGCTVNGDCPSGACCNGGACTLRHYTNVELCQNNISGSAVTCALYMDGKPAAGGSILSVTDPVGLWTNGWFGAVSTDTTSSTWTAYMDDFVTVINATRAKVGYVDHTTPGQDSADTASLPLDWGSSGSGGNDFDRIDDYRDDAFEYKDNTTVDGRLIPTRASRIENFTAPKDLLSIASGGRVTAVEAVAFGRANGTSVGVREYRAAIMHCLSNSNCPGITWDACQGDADCLGGVSGSCNTADGICDFNITNTTTDRMLHRIMAYTPGDPTEQTWSTSSIQRIGWHGETTASHTNEITRFVAINFYIRVELPDAPAIITLKDHTGDGRVVVCPSGHSLNGGANGAVCSGHPEKSCQQDTQCNWSVLGAEPQFGCTTNSQCITCTLRRLEFGGGAGYPCTSDSNCGNTGTCDLDCGDGICNVCAKNNYVPCTSDAECAGGAFDLGTCQTTGACVRSCPNLNCTSNCTDLTAAGTKVSCGLRVGWGSAMDTLAADLVVSYVQNGSSSETLRNVMIPGIVAGQFSGAKHVSGSSTCQCRENQEIADCGTATNNGSCSDTTSLCTQGAGRFNCLGTCTCTTDAECDSAAGGDGDCNNGICIAGDAQKKECTKAAECATGRLCAFDACDYVPMMSNVADGLVFTSPNCQGLYATVPRSLGAPTECDMGDEPACIQDADCDAWSPSGRCIGRYVNDPSSACLDPGFLAGLGGCTALAAPCNVTADCPASFTCVDGTAGDPLPQGMCQCDSDADCASVYTAFGITKCSNGFCRKPCSVDADCPGSDSGRCAGGACKGRCETRCDHLTCSVDSDCDRTAHGWTVDREFGGTCSGGVCTGCGPNACPYDDYGFPGSYERWARNHSHFLALDNYEAIANYMAGLTDFGNGPPVPIFVTEPRFRMHGIADSRVGCEQIAQYGDFEYPRLIAAHLNRESARFPHVVDIAPVVAGYPSDSVFTTDVHFKALGSQIVGGAVVDYMHTLNACRSDTTLKAMPYCRAGATYGSQCPVGNECGAGETCVRRLCTGAGDCPGSGDSCFLE